MIADDYDAIAKRLKSIQQEEDGVPAENMDGPIWSNTPVAHGGTEMDLILESILEVIRQIELAADAGTDTGDENSDVNIIDYYDI